MDKVGDSAFATSAQVSANSVAGYSLSQMRQPGIVSLDAINHTKFIANCTKRIDPSPAIRDSGFKWGSTSLFNQKRVLPMLISVANLALRYSTIDFMFYCGVRTKEEQEQAILHGTTKTRSSLHFIQSDGFSHAMDLVPLIGGLPKWDWDGCYRIAAAVDLAATELGCAGNIVWGGAWDRTLADFGGDLHAYAAEVQAYQRRHQGVDFVDGPHFQWRA